MAYDVSIFGQPGKMFVYDNEASAAGTMALIPAADVAATEHVYVLGGMIALAGNATTARLEDTGSVNMGPTVTTAGSAAASMVVPVPPLKVPTAGRGLQVIVGGAGPVVSAWVWGFIR